MAVGGVVLLWGLDTSVARLVWSLFLVLVLLAVIEATAAVGRRDLTGPG